MSVERAEAAKDRPVPGHGLWACGLWFRFHFGRLIRRRSFLLWAVALLIFAVLAQGGLMVRRRALVELVVLAFTPLLTLFFCTGVLREEIEDKTLTYGFSRPVGRSWLYLGRVLAALTVVWVLLLPLIVLTATPLGIDRMLTVGLTSALSALAYGGLFALTGQLIRWPTFFGLMYVLFWEMGVGQLPGFLGRLTLAAHARGLAGFAPKNKLMEAFWAPPSVGQAVVVLGITALVSLYLGGQLAARREHRGAK